MSLPFRDQLHVALAPTEVVHLRRSIGTRGATVDSGVVRVQPTDGGPPWRAPLEGLANLWPKLAERRASVRLVLSNCFVRYAVVPWRDGLRSPAERDGYLRHCFREAYGEAADAWAIRENPEAHGRPSLACAVDRDLLDALRELPRGTKLRLGAIQPLFMCAFNEHRSALGTTGCFLVYDHGRLCGASYEGGEWKSTLATRVQEGRLTAALVEREILLAGIGEEIPVFLCIVDGSPPPEGMTRLVKVLPARKRMHLDFAAARLGALA